METASDYSEDGEISASASTEGKQTRYQALTNWLNSQEFQDFERSGFGEWGNRETFSDAVASYDSKATDFLAKHGVALPQKRPASQNSRPSKRVKYDPKSTNTFSFVPGKGILDDKGNRIILGNTELSESHNELYEASLNAATGEPISQVPSDVSTILQQKHAGVSKSDIELRMRFTATKQAKFSAPKKRLIPFSDGKSHGWYRFDMAILAQMGEIDFSKLPSEPSDFISSASRYAKKYKTSAHPMPIAEQYLTRHLLARYFRGTDLALKLTRALSLVVAHDNEALKMVKILRRTLVAIHEPHHEIMADIQKLHGRPKPTEFNNSQKELIKSNTENIWREPVWPDSLSDSHGLRPPKSLNMKMVPELQTLQNKLFSLVQNPSGKGPRNHPGQKNGNVSTRNPRQKKNRSYKCKVCKIFHKAGFVCPKANQKTKS